MERTPEFRLVSAARNVGNAFHYYTPAAVRVRFRQDNKNTPTMAVNASLVISYNEEFVQKLTDSELSAVVLHELLHYMNGHHARYMNSALKDTVPFETHNVAMDIEINEFIDNLPADACKAKGFGFPERKSYEEYLLLLKEDMQDNGGRQGKGRQGNPAQCKMPVNDLNLDGYDDTHRAILNTLIEECKEHEKNRGSESAFDEAIRKIKKRKYRWEQVFQNIISAKVTEIISGFRYRTFEKANRRYVHTPGIILPVFVDRKVKISLAIIMDVSGSMGDLTDKMYGIMKSMVDILNMDIDITILEVDAAVVHILHGFDLNRDTVESARGGGTDMGAGLHYIQEHDIKSDLIMVMTDSETPWPDPPLFSGKTVVLTDNPDVYDGPYPVYPVVFGED